MWSLFSPSVAPELLNTYGEKFDQAYEEYERQGKAMKKVSARTLYSRMMQSLAETGNGWICYKDKANQRSAQTAEAGNIIHSSNLCTEILEVTSKDETAVCNLGSVNLSSFVTKEQKFDFEKLREVVNIATKFLDKVIDINFYPINEAKNSNQRWRPVGLGIMGLQDVFFKMRIPFESPEATKLSSKISETIYFQAITTSMNLARNDGKFPAFEASRYADGDLQVQLAQKNQPTMPELNYNWEELARQVKTYGIRNSLLIAIAPTATIASIVGSYESIEPQISNFFKRETLSGEFLNVNRYLVNDLKKFGLYTPALRAKIIEHEGSIQDIEEIPSEIKALYKTVWEIPQKSLIEMAASRSPFICQSQSLNLFLEDPTIGKLSSMYMYAWKQGIKTTYYLRSRAKTSIKKTTISQPVTAAEAQAAVACSLENPETCEACQ